MAKFSAAAKLTHAGGFHGGLCRSAYQPPVETKTAVPEAAKHSASQAAKARAWRLAGFGVGDVWVAFIFLAFNVSLIAWLAMETIESHIQGFFVQALQLDPGRCGLRPCNSRLRMIF